VADTARFADFADFEREGWQRVAGRYAATFGRCTSQTIAPMLDTVQISPGEALLDLACGPGYAASAAVERGAKASGLDLSEEMIAIAQNACPAGDFRLGDVSTLPWAAESFDVVVSNFGLHHTPDLERVLLEVRRVLREAGRFAFTVWEISGRSIAQRLLHEAVDAAGVRVPAMPDGPPAHALADASIARAALGPAGFTLIASRPIEVRLRASDARAALEVFRTGTVRLGSMLKPQGAAEIERIAAAFAERLVPWTGPDGVDVPMTAVLTDARVATSARMARLNP
jgi:SAM-dependent methyltransferase